MARMIFVNLPVADVAKATAFYEAIGFTRNDGFSNARASVMAWSDTIHVMLLHEDFYRTFTTKRIADARTTSEVLLCLSRDSREEVDAIAAAALAAGGRAPRAAEDHGFMYGRTFEDLDGHVFEPMWMDMAAATAAMTAQFDRETAAA